MYLPISVYDWKICPFSVIFHTFQQIIFVKIPYRQNNTEQHSTVLSFIHDEWYFLLNNAWIALWNATGTIELLPSIAKLTSYIHYWPRMKNTFYSAHQQRTFVWQLYISMCSVKCLVFLFGDTSGYSGLIYICRICQRDYRLYCRSRQLANARWIKFAHDAYCRIEMNHQRPH